MCIKDMLKSLDDAEFLLESSHIFLHEEVAVFATMLAGKADGRKANERNIYIYERGSKSDCVGE